MQETMQAATPAVAQDQDFAQQIAAGTVSLPRWLAGRATPNELAVLFSLQGHYPRIEPSINAIARETCLSPSSVRRTLADLSERGWIQVEQRIGDDGRNLPNRYRLAIWAMRSGR